MTNRQMKERIRKNAELMNQHIERAKQLRDYPTEKLAVWNYLALKEWKKYIGEISEQLLQANRALFILRFMKKYMKPEEYTRIIYAAEVAFALEEEMNDDDI